MTTEAGWLLLVIYLLSLAAMLPTLTKDEVEWRHINSVMEHQKWWRNANVKDVSIALFWSCIPLFNTVLVFCSLGRVWDMWLSLRNRHVQR